MNQPEKTIQSIFNLWYWNFQNPSLQQFSNLFHATIALLKFYNKEEKYDSTLAYLNELYDNPVFELSKKYNKITSGKNTLTWTISDFEWCYFRDTKFKSKLSKMYEKDSRKPSESQKMILSEMINLLSKFKAEMFLIMIQILIENKLDIYIALPAGNREIEQLRGDEIA